MKTAFIKITQIALPALMICMAVNAAATDRFDFSDSEAKKQHLEQRLQQIKEERIKPIIKHQCDTEMDCPQPKCPDCRMLCIQGKCTFVQCRDHGTFDPSKGGCICNPGYTGTYCEKTTNGALAPRRPRSNSKFKRER